MLESNKQKFDICNITDYHNKGYKGQGVKVAVLDTPFKPDERYGKNIEYINGGDSKELSSHGSNSVNVVSQVAPEATIYFLPFGVDSLEWCIGKDIDIITMSASYNYDVYERFHEISEELYNEGKILFTSAGNYKVEEDNLRYPGKSKPWIAVGALWYISDNNFRVASYSSYTKTEMDKIWEQVEISGITSLKVVDLKEDGEVSTYGGTSCASPFIAGMTALAMQKYGFEGAEDFREWKQDNTIEIGEQDGYSLRKGYGLLTLPRENTEIVMREDSREYKVNGKTKEMDTEPIIKDGRTLVPIRFVAEALGYSVDWDSETRKITISD